MERGWERLKKEDLGKKTGGKIALKKSPTPKGKS